VEVSLENRVLRKMFGSEREKVADVWREVLNNDVYNLYSLPNIIGVFKSRRMRWMGMYHAWDR
jgi:hypothetical protein